MTKHYSIPLLNETEFINLVKFDINQPVLIKHSDGYKIYFVKVNTISLEYITDAIDNKHIVPIEEALKSDIPVDDITIDFANLWANKSTGDDFEIAINRYWISGNDTPIGVTFRRTTYYDGTLFGNKDDYWFLTEGGTSITFEPGTYEFYSSEDVTSASPALEDDGGVAKYFSFVGYENGLYRYRLDLTESFDATALTTESTQTKSTAIWLIDRFADNNESEVTIKGIDKIIGADGISIDGSGMIANNPQKEIVTRDFIEKRTGQADDITLEQINLEVQYDESTNFQEWFHNAWDDTITVQDWNIESGSFSNGVFTIPAGTDIPATGHLKIISNDNPSQFTSYRYLKFSLNQDLFLGAISFEDYTGGVAAAFDISPQQKEILPNGDILYSILIPAGFHISNVYLNGSGTLSEDLNIKLVDMEAYPPSFVTSIKNIDHIIDNTGYSIDGSNTPMSDPHRELVTRAFVEDKAGSAVNADDITIEQENAFMPRSTKQDLQKEILNWYEDQLTADWETDAYYVPTESAFKFPSETASTILHYTGNAEDLLPLQEERTFYIYCTFKASDAETVITAHSANGTSVTSDELVYENGLYRYRITLPSGFQLDTLYFSVTGGTPSGTLWLVDAFADQLQDQISIKNINHIIGADNISIDDLYVVSVNPKEELPNLEYVQKKIPNADEITITKNEEQTVTSTVSDYQLVANDAWGDTFETENWALDETHVTYTNGEFHLVVNNENIELNVLTNTNVQTQNEDIVIRFMADQPFNVDTHYDIELIDSVTGWSTKKFDSKDLGNGWYVYSFMVPAGEGFDKIRMWYPISWGGGSADIRVRFVDSESYPPKEIFKIKEIDYIIDDDGESIDGSNTPMSDPHRELITRAYADNSFIVNVDNVTTQYGRSMQYVSTVEDYAYVMQDAFSPNAPTSHIQLGNSFTYNYGLFEHTSTEQDSLIIYTDDESADWGATDLYVYVSKDFPDSNLQLGDGSNVLNFTKIGIGEDGWILYHLSITGGAWNRILWDTEATIPGDTYKVFFIKNTEYKESQKLKVFNISGIIGSDNFSIDENHRPMALPDNEIPTRGYVEKYVGSLAYWVQEASPTGFGDQLRPTSANVKRVEVINNDRGITEFFVGNYNTSDNYTGSSITLTTNSNNYTQQLFLAIHGDNYYQTDLAKRGMIGTDSSLYISAYNSTDRQGQPAFIAFQVGDDYYNRKDIFRLTTRGLEMPLDEKKIWYQAGTIVQDHPTNYTQLYVNVDTSEVYAGPATRAFTERFILTSTDVSNGYIQLSNTPNTDEHLFVYYEGLLLDENTDGDFTISGDTITFTDEFKNNVLSEGDKVIVKYRY